MKLIRVLALLLACLVTVSGFAQTNKINVSAGTRWNPLADTGSANTYVVTFSSAGTTLYNGLPLVFMAANTNTGPSTLNLNGLGAKAITKNGGTADVDPGDIQAGAILLVVYDGTDFQLLTSTSLGGCGTGMTVGAIMTASSSTNCQTPNSLATLDVSGNMNIPGTLSIGNGTTPMLMVAVDQTGTVATPAASHTNIYTKSSQLCYKDPSAVEHCGFGTAGTVTSFSAGALSPLFTTSVATATTTPALSFSLSNAAAHKFFGNNTGSTGAPAFDTVNFGDLGGNILTSQMNSGTNADSSHYWRGDGVWAAGPTITIASGTATLGTSAIAAGNCATVVTVSATGVATTDTIHADFNADPTSTTGFNPAIAGGSLTIIKYPTANNVNFKVCNYTASSITPGAALTLNWSVTR